MLCEESSLRIRVNRLSPVIVALVIALGLDALRRIVRR